MGKNKIIILNFIFIFSMVLSACIYTPTPEPLRVVMPTKATLVHIQPTKVVLTRTPAPDPLYAGFTNDPLMPYLAIHESGERLGIEKDAKGVLTRIVWSSADGHGMTIYPNEKGLPKIAVLGDEVIRYTNYTSTTMDVILIHPNGTRNAFRAKIDKNRLKKFSADVDPSSGLVSYALPDARQPQLGTVMDTLKQGLYLLNFGACLSPMPDSVDKKIVDSLRGVCEGVIISTAVQAGQIANIYVKELTRISNNSIINGCETVNPGACMEKVTTELKDQAKTAGKKIELFIPPTPEPTDTY